MEGDAVSSGFDCISRRFFAALVDPKARKSNTEMQSKAPKMHFRHFRNTLYYLCEAERRVVPQTLEDYEAEEGFQLEYVVPSLAIRRNRSFSGSAYNPARLERAARVLELLIADGLL